MIKIDWHPEEKQLRQFGFIALVGFPVMGLVFWLFASAPDTLLYSLLGLGVLCPILDLIHPPLLWPIYVTMMLLSILIGIPVSYTLLALIYYLMFTPVGLLFRLLGKDPLTKGPDESLSSYWIVRKTAPSPASYLRLY